MKTFQSPFFFIGFYIFLALPGFGQVPPINDELWYTIDSRYEPSLWSYELGINNVQYNKVISRLKSYSADTNPNGCLAIENSQQKTFAIKPSDEEGILVTGPHTPEYYEARMLRLKDTTVTIRFYKNICNKVIVLKGMMRKENSKYMEQSKFSYFNVSKIVQPGEKVDYFKFTKGGWNDDSQYNTQYFLDEDVQKMRIAKIYPVSSVSTPESIPSSNVTSAPITDQQQTQYNSQEDMGVTDQQLRDALDRYNERVKFAPYQATEEQIRERMLHPSQPYKPEKRTKIVPKSPKTPLVM